MVAWWLWFGGLEWCMRSTKFIMQNSFDSFYELEASWWSGSRGCRVMVGMVAAAVVVE